MTDERTTLRPISVPTQRGTAAGGEDQGHDILGLLAAGIPLTLLIDLAPPSGPDSRLIFDAERVEVEMLRSA